MKWYDPQRTKPEIGQWCIGQPRDVEVAQRTPYVLFKMTSTTNLQPLMAWIYVPQDEIM